jgi:hypothetical protein
VWQLLGYSAVFSVFETTFRWNVSPPTTRPKLKQNKKPKGSIRLYNTAAEGNIHDLRSEGLISYILVEKFDVTNTTSLRPRSNSYGTRSICSVGPRLEVGMLIQSQAKITLRPTVIRPVSPGIRPTCETLDQFFRFHGNSLMVFTVFVIVEGPLRREGRSVIFSAAIRQSEPHGSHNHTLLSH